jgi:PhnB protein
MLYPFLVVRNAAEAVDFYVAALGAREIYRLTEPSGRIGHVELELDGSPVMLAEEFPEYGILAPPAGSRCPLILHIHVDNADAAVARAVSAGATLIRPLQDELHGERAGTVRDPFGYEWMLGHPIEEVSPEEMQRRYTAMMS